MLYPHISVNENGHLTVGGQDTVELAARYGTPLYLLDEDRVRDNCRRYAEAVRRYLGEDSYPLYAGKALCFKGIYPIVAEEGLGIDVVSGGEIYTAKVAGFPMEKSYFHGNNKTEDEIAYAMEAGVGCIVVDNPQELMTVDRLSAQRGIKQKILLRVTPGIDSHTFKAVSTGQLDSKFGMPIQTGQAREFCEQLCTLSHLEFMGFHCHIGSQIFDCQPFFDTADVMLAFTAEMRDAFGLQTRVLDLGSGFGIPYKEGEPTADLEQGIRGIGEHIAARCAEYNLPRPAILLEPGRAIVGDAGVTLYTVGSVKEIPDCRNYVSIDGGMTDNPRYALYQAEHAVVNASRAAEAATYPCAVAGRCCESGDMIREHVLVARPQAGDILAVLTTGAYNFSMSSNYNRVLRPALVMLKDGESRVVVRRQTYADLVDCDL